MEEEREGHCEPAKTLQWTESRARTGEAGSVHVLVAKPLVHEFESLCGADTKGGIPQGWERVSILRCDWQRGGKVMQRDSQDNCGASLWGKILSVWLLWL